MISGVAAKHGLECVWSVLGADILGSKSYKASVR